MDPIYQAYISIDDATDTELHIRILTESKAILTVITAAEGYKGSPDNQKGTAHQEHLLFKRRLFRNEKFLYDRRWTNNFCFVEDKTHQIL
ncbi:Hypothetical predicted protein [Mytilus galloprovincialis]|uniref:Uncharacterized protein n=1 Tax=Mytilus galloprovincialis TaxID=29158 RepID=A0A8B6DV82_MYTGA|nr:Hypothetical predicted protein [Mytilus galloprovincialis]